LVLPPPGYQVIPDFYRVTAQCDYTSQLPEDPWGRSIPLRGPPRA
jgi:hypothetical protein